MWNIVFGMRMNLHQVPHTYQNQTKQISNNNKNTQQIWCWANSPSPRIHTAWRFLPNCLLFFPLLSLLFIMSLPLLFIFTTVIDTQQQQKVEVTKASVYVLLESIIDLGVQHTYNRARSLNSFPPFFISTLVTTTSRFFLPACHVVSYYTITWKIESIPTFIRYHFPCIALLTVQKYTLHYKMSPKYTIFKILFYLVTSATMGKHSKE